MRIQVEPARRALGARCEVRKSVADLLDRRAQSARPAGGRQRVGHVVAGQPADRDRDGGDLDDRGLRPAVGLDDDPRPHQVGTPAALAMAPHDRRRIRLEREQGDLRLDPPGDRRDERDRRH